MESLKVYESISNVSKELIENGGISKEKPEKEKGKSATYGTPDYAFRSIDQIYNTLGPALVRNKLIILPRMVDRQVTERISSKGNSLIYVVVSGEFDFISIEDGSKVTIKTFGEAMDTGDKATNKAMSIAYKYAAFQAFCIPTEETTQDADKETHVVLPPPTEVQEPSTEEQKQSPDKPKVILTPDYKGWENAIKSCMKHGNLDVVKKHAIVTPEIENIIVEIASSRKSLQHEQNASISQDDDIPL